jgi:hypothetical protein
VQILLYPPCQNTCAQEIFLLFCITFLAAVWVLYIDKEFLLNRQIIENGVLGHGGLVLVHTFWGYGIRFCFAAHNVHASSVFFLFLKWIMHLRFHPVIFPLFFQTRAGATFLVTVSRRTRLEKVKTLRPLGFPLAGCFSWHQT